MTEKTARYGWISLISFGFMYNMVYMGRFSVINFMDGFAKELVLSDMQQEVLVICVFASYAAGSLITGFIADRWNAKKTIVAGGILTSAFNILMVFAGSRELLFVLCICNGISQSAIWTGGINIIAQWFEEEEWGKSVGIANFFSGISHITAYVLPAIAGALLPFAGWRAGIIIPIMMLVVFTVLFGVLSVSGREDKGIEPYSYKSRERTLNETFLRNNKWNYHTLVIYLFTRKYFMLWCLIALLSSICRYGLFQWIPVYFGGGEGVSIFSVGFEQVLLPTGMAFGTMIITWFAGARFLDNKGIVVVAMAALCASTAIVFPMVGSARALRVGIFILGFVIYGINGILWLHAIDQGGRIFPGTVAGILNAFAYLGAALQGLIYSAALRIFDSYITICIVTELICILLILCATMICKNETVIAEQRSVRDSKID